MNMASDFSQFMKFAGGAMGGLTVIMESYNLIFANSSTKIEEK